MITSSVKALRNNRKWAIGLKKSPFIETSTLDIKVTPQVSQARDLPVVEKWMISLKNGPDIGKSSIIETSTLERKEIPKFSHARDLPVVEKWMISLKKGPEMDSNTKKKLLSKAEIDLFSFSSQNAYQNEMHESSEQDEELYRGIDILLTAHAPQILDSFAEFCKMVAEEFGPLGVEFDGFSNPRLHKDRWELNKSPFIYGRHMTSYETRTYKKVVHLLYLTGTTRELILNYIERNVPAGVGIEVKSFKLAQFPAELEKHIERNFDTLSVEEKMRREEFLAMDNMKMRKLDIAHYEMRRKPWNPTKKDYEQMEIMGFRRYYRQPATFGRI